MRDIYRCPFCHTYWSRPICNNHSPIRVSWIYKISPKELDDLFEIILSSDYYQITLQIQKSRTYLYYDGKLIANTELLPITPENYYKYKRRLLGLKAFL